MTFDLDNPGGYPQPHQYEDVNAAVLALDAFAGREAQVREGMVCMVGSYGYGLETADSDLDMRGFYVAPTTEVLSLNQPPPQLASAKSDITVYELGKFIELIAFKASPSALETLWADATMCGAAGELLREHRQAFLTEKVRFSYGGYAAKQLRSVLEMVGGTSRPEKRAKVIRHIFRIYSQAEQILTTGDFTYRLDPDQQAWVRSKETLTDGELKDEFTALDERVKNLKTDLSMDPNRELISELLVKIRMDYARRELA